MKESFQFSDFLFLYEILYETLKGGQLTADYKGNDVTLILSKTDEFLRKVGEFLKNNIFRDQIQAILKLSQNKTK